MDFEQGPSAMAEFIDTVGLTVCQILSAADLFSGSCYYPDTMRVLGTLSTFLAMLTAGMWVLMRE